MAITVLIFLVYGAFCGIILPSIRPIFTQTTSQIKLVSVWTAYSLFVDSFVGLFFMYHLSRMLMKNHSEETKMLTRKMIYFLALLFTFTWTGFIVAASSAFCEIMPLRRLLYRLGFSVSTLQFTGAIVYPNLTQYFLLSIQEIYDLGTAESFPSVHVRPKNHHILYDQEDKIIRNRTLDSDENFIY